MFKRTRPASIALFGTPIRVGVAFALLALLAVGVVAWADAPTTGAPPSKNATSIFAKPGVSGKAGSVEQGAGRTARRYLAPLLNRPKVATKVSVGDCKPAGGAFRLCIVEVNSPIADCTLGVRLRLYESGKFFGRGASLRCR